MATSRNRTKQKQSVYVTPHFLSFFFLFFFLFFYSGKIQSHYIENGVDWTVVYIYGGGGERG